MNPAITPTTGHHSKTDLYRQLLAGKTIRNSFPGNELTVKVVDDKFCALINGKYIPYTFHIGNPLNWKVCDGD